MEPAPSLFRPGLVARLWIAFAAYWLVFSALFAVSHTTQLRWAGRGVDPAAALSVGVVQSVTIALLCLTALGFAWRLQIERGTWRRLAGSLIATYVLGACLMWARADVLARITGGVRGSLFEVLLAAAPVQLLLSACFLGAGFAIRYFVHMSDRVRTTARLSEESARMELQLARSQLQVLKMQLDPHFLFNTFNAVTALIPRDPAAAERMLMQLGELLRITLSRSGDQEVTLSEELDFVRTYLEIQQSRFGDRLTVEWRVEPGTESACVPHLILQPLAENAIQHGIARVPGPGRVRIGAWRAGECLVLEVADSGPGMRQEWVPRPGGVGLANTLARLERLYGAGHALEMRTAEAGGAVVRVSLPFRAPAAAEEGSCAS